MTRIKQKEDCISPTTFARQWIVASFTENVIIPNLIFANFDLQLKGICTGFFEISKFNIFPLC